MQVGQIEESITVTGESPLVDVRSTVSQSVMNREALDTIPTGRDPFAVGQLIPGVTTNTPDVGGTQIMQQPTLQVHGSSNNDNVFMVDNVQIQHIGFGGNQTGFYFNDGLMEEISYQTSSLPAEAPVGGVQINMIPRDGGNQFHGTLFATAGNTRFQSNNLDDDLIALGFTAQNRVESIYDFNVTYGGPMRAQPAVVLQYVPPLVGQQLSRQHVRRATATQAVDDQRISDGTLRLTWQAARSHKLSLLYDRSAKWRGHRPNNWIGASINEPLSSVEQTTGLNYIGQLKWSAPLSSRLLAEASVFTLPVNYNLEFQEDADPNAIATFDQIRSIVTGVSPRQDINTARMYTYAGFVSYVTGSHNLKTGNADSQRVVTGTVRDARGHRPDRLQRRAPVGPARQQPERAQGIGRQHRRLHPGFVDIWPRHD